MKNEDLSPFIKNKWTNQTKNAFKKLLHVHTLNLLVVQITSSNNEENR